MKVNTLLRPWKGDKRFTQMSRQAAAWKKAGQTDAEIVTALEAEYGRSEPVAGLRDAPAPFHVYGEIGADINPVAVSQLKLALRLPIALAGALMPDAHVGYALPIGGVFAAHRAVSPAMVGVDIGCRMHLSLFALPPEEFRQPPGNAVPRLAGRDDVRRGRKRRPARRPSDFGRRPLAVDQSDARLAGQGAAAARNKRQRQPLRGTGRRRTSGHRAAACRKPLAGC